MLGVFKKNRYIVHRCGKLKCLHIAGFDFFNNLPAGNGRHKVDIFLRNHAILHQIVTGPFKDILSRRQIAECPLFLAQPFQADTGHRPGITHRLHKIAGALVTASGNRDGHDILLPLVIDALEEIEAGFTPVVDAFAVNKTEELIEVGTERNPRIVNKTPCLIQARTGYVGRIKSLSPDQGTAYTYRGNNVALEFLWYDRSG